MSGIWIKVGVLFLKNALLDFFLVGNKSFYEISAGKIFSFPISPWGNKEKFTKVVL